MEVTIQRAERPLDALEVLLQTCAATGKIIKPKRGLYVATHGQKDVLGKTLLGAAGVSTVERAEGTEQEVIEQLRAQVRAGVQFDMAVAAFALHHFSDKQRTSAMQELRKLTRDGALLYSDYTLLGMPGSALVETATGSTFEKKQKEAYGGEEAWLAAHCQDSLASLIGNVTRVNFHFCTGFAIPAYRGVVVASDTTEEILLLQETIKHPG